MSFLFAVHCSINRWQGQDEVPRGAVVTDYGDSVLIPSAIVNHTNDEIRKLGGEKVRIQFFQTVFSLLGGGDSIVVI